MGDTWVSVQTPEYKFAMLSVRLATRGTQLDGKRSSPRTISAFRLSTIPRTNCDSIGSWCVSIPK